MKYYKPAVSSQILWSASLVLSNTVRIGLVVKSVEEIELKLVLELLEGGEKTRLVGLENLRLCADISSQPRDLDTFTLEPSQ